MPIYLASASTRSSHVLFAPSSAGHGKITPAVFVYVWLFWMFIPPYLLALPNHFPADELYLSFIICPHDPLMQISRSGFPTVTTTKTRLGTRGVQMGHWRVSDYKVISLVVQSPGDSWLPKMLRQVCWSTLPNVVDKWQ